MRHATFTPKLTDEQLRTAKDWILDCFDEVDPSDLTEAVIVRGIERHYDGGLRSFLMGF